MCSSDLCGRPGFNPWVGKIPWRRERLPSPVFWPAEFHRRYSLQGRKESDTTERLSVSQGKRVSKRIDPCLTELLCCTLETNRMLSINYNAKSNKLKKKKNLAPLSIGRTIHSQIRDFGSLYFFCELRCRTLDTGIQTHHTSSLSHFSWPGQTF